jgi:two-component system sensor histidine kinase/response regulator
LIIELCTPFLPFWRKNVALPVSCLPVCTLEESAARGDAPRLERTAHMLRSAAGNLGARKLATLCAELETLVLTGAIEANATLVNGIVVEAGRVAAALREL